MDSHSYSGFNASGSSFLQELTVEDSAKDVYAGSQTPQQRPYQQYQDPNTSHYPPATDIPSSSYYNGQYNSDPYYFNHPQYPQRNKYPDNSYAANPAAPPQPNPNIQPASRAMTMPNTSAPGWAESQPMPAYQSDPYAHQPTFQSSGRMHSPGYPQSVSGPHTHQQPYLNPMGPPYSTMSGHYPHNEMNPPVYSGAAIPPPTMRPNMPVNGEAPAPYPHQVPRPPPQPVVKPAVKKSPKPRPQTLPKAPQPSNPPLPSPNAQIPPNVAMVTPPPPVELPCPPAEPPCQSVNSKPPISTELPVPPPPPPGPPKIEEPPKLEKVPNCETTPTSTAPILEKEELETQQPPLPAPPILTPPVDAPNATVQSPTTVKSPESVQPGSNSSTLPATQLSPPVAAAQPMDISSTDNSATQEHQVCSFFSTHNLIPACALCVA